MKVKNKTRYDTRELRSIFCAVHNAIAKREGKLPQWRHLEVEVVYSIGQRQYRGVYEDEKLVRIESHRVPGSSGYTFIHGNWMRLRYPKEKVTRRSVAYLFGHELMHNYGYKHKQFNDGPIWEIANTFEGDLVEKPPKPKPKRDLQVERYESLLKREKDWQKKFRRADNALRKIKKSKRYYEKTLRAAGKLREDE